MKNLRIKIFADGADKKSILAMYQNPVIQGFTTNPSLMRQAGIRDYKAFALDVLSTIKDKPISFEIFADDFAEMYQQALEIASWGKNVYVKIPVMNTKGQDTYPLIQKLAHARIKQNITAIMTLEQITKTIAALSQAPAAYISVFAGRIADTGRDPLETMRHAMHMLEAYPHIELIWASPRELLNVFQANNIGCHIITATHDIIKKLDIIDKDLHEYSLETVRMFYNDAMAAGLTLETEALA